MTIYTNDPAQSGQTAGTVATSANTGGGTNLAFTATGGTVTFDASFPWDSAQDYHIAAPTGIQAYIQLNLPVQGAANAVRFYDYFTGTVTPTTNTILLQLGGSGLDYLGVLSTGKPFVVLNGATAYSGSTYTLLANTVYRFEVYYTVAAGTATFQYAVYIGDSLTSVDSWSTTTGNTGSTNPTAFYFGKKQTSGNWTDQYISQIAINNAATGYIGPATTNSPPTANAGPDQSSLEPYSTVTLDGSGSSDSDGTVASYAWTQTSGTPTVTLSSSTAQKPTFTAPATVAGSSLVFSLVVTDNLGANSTADTVSIGVLSHTIFKINSSGVPEGIQVERL